MSFLIRDAFPASTEPARALLSLADGEALCSALGAMELEDAALAVERAPTLEERSRLVWALSPERRCEVLDQLHPGFLGALIQNREEENRRLLADLSREQFTRLLRFCNPEQAFYWLSLATSFDDARANMLPLLVPVEELATALLSVREFAVHCQEVGEYSVEDFSLDLDEFAGIASATVAVYGPKGVIEEFPILEGTPVRDSRLRRLLHTLEHHPDRYNAVVTVISAEGEVEEIPVPDTRLRRLFHKILDYDLEQYTALLNLFGPEGVLREFPIRNRRVRRLLKVIIDFDPSRYIELVQAALELSDYTGSHSEEQEELRDAPLLLDSLLSIDEERARAGLAPEPAAETGPGVAAPDPAPIQEEPERGGSMTFLTRSGALDPNDPLHALLALEEDEALEAALAAMEPDEVVMMVARAPSVEDRTRLVWSLTPERRGEVLNRLHPGFVGALIQNLEEENKFLLGDLSREQYARMVRFCNPGQAYYWLTLATSFEDVRANMLPLLVPMRDLAPALLTMPEFETHCQRIGDYSVEDMGLNIEGFHDLADAILTVFGADGMLREFPIRDTRLRRLLQTILDHEPEAYAELIHVSLEQMNYGANHSEEKPVLQDDPILLEDLLTVGEERARAGLTPPPSAEERPKVSDVRSVPSLPVRQSAELMRAAASALPAQRQGELSQELQLLYMQEAAYAGGSFLQTDLERAAGRVQSYVQLGLAGLSEGDAAQATRLLSEQRLRTLMESGARQVERLRQVGLRLLPWREVLDAAQIHLLEGLEHPDMGVEEGSGRPILRLPAIERRAKPQSLDLEQVRVQLEAISAWTRLVRAVGKTRIALRMEGSSTAALTRSLVVAAIMYRHWDPALVEAGDIARFRETYRDPTTGRFTEPAFRALAEAVRALAAERKLDQSAVQEIARLLARAMDELSRDEQRETSDAGAGPE